MKEKLKVYHGLPKTPTDENTAFYCSFEGSLEPQTIRDVKVNNQFTSSIYDYIPSTSNYGLKITSSSSLKYYVDLEFDSYVTVDFWDTDGAIRVVTAPTSSNNVKWSDYFLNKTETGVTIFNPVTSYKVDTTKLHHYRFIIEKEKSVKVYIDGKLIAHEFPTETRHRLISSPLRVYISNKYGNGDFNNTVVGGCLCDLHISTVDRGDYFPTLPQDFIDGKAIVVPSLNQRQSYGDPVLHQVTELLVPCTKEGQNFYNTELNSYWQHDTLPELSVTEADTWTNGAKIRIKGLEKSIITGVFDTDTAKCRIVKEVTSSNVVPVDSVSGISVGDSLVYVYSSDFRAGSNTYTVQALDSVNNTITLSSTTNWHVGDYFFETTASSSCPVVKTVDGTVVNGTWSGLGTNVATFTLGSNSNIEGKDLVVTYCLNAKGNSSPYPKMPSEVIRGYDELGNEMLPTRTVGTYVYLENSEEDCNPILVDMQTKEVKRLLPSTAPFSTEVLVHNPTTMSTPTTTLIKGTDNVMTTLGSGSSCNEYDVMRGLIGKLGMESHLYTNDTLNKLTYYSVSDHDQRTKIVPRQYYLHNYAKNEIAGEDVPKDMSLLAVAYDLVVTDSKEVAMKTLCHVIENGERTEYITHTYVLPNRPLIK